MIKKQTKYAQNSSDIIGALDWQKNFQGPWTLYECCYYGEQMVRGLKKSFGAGLSNAVFIFHGGVGSNYVVEEEVKELSRLIAKKLIENPRLAQNWVGGVKRQANKVFNFIRQTKGRLLTLEDAEVLWGILNNYYVANFPIKKVPDYLPPALLKKILPLFQETRLYGEPVYARSNLFIKRFARQLSKKAKPPLHLLLSMTREELMGYLKNEILPSKKELKLRYAGSALVFHKGKRLLLIGKDATTVENLVVKSNAKTKFIKGVSACRGVVRGRVKIVFDPSKTRNYPENSILVTGMTRPEYLALIKKSLAIITDAGGMLSHAAIIARELKIPTIVGTETATKVLKDGDMVEVDADKGIIKILSRNY